MAGSSSERTHSKDFDELGESPGNWFLDSSVDHIEYPAAPASLHDSHLGVGGEFLERKLQPKTWPPIGRQVLADRLDQRLRRPRWAALGTSQRRIVDDFSTLRLTAGERIENLV
jgi:hypothetical protein